MLAVDIMNNAQWADIQAVKDGKVYTTPAIPFNWFDRPPNVMRLLGIEWFLPAVNWAAETGVTGGTAEGAFAAARHLTWQEAAVFLVRTAEALGLEPEAVRTAPLPDALAEGAWDQTALELAWEWGLLPEDAGSAAEIARVQGGAMADAFAALL